MTRISIPILALAALVAGCGSSSSSSSPSTSGPASTGATPSAPGSAITLTETEFKISPASARVAKPGSVTITVKNAGSVTHSFEVEGPSGEKRTPAIQPGASATLTLDASKPGRLEFYCPIDGHKQRGMKGVLTVGGGSASSGATKTSGATTPGGTNTSGGATPGATYTSGY